MNRNTRGSFSGRTGLESGSTTTTKKQDKDKLAQKIIAKLSLLKEVDLSLITTITTKLSENKLSLIQLKKLHDLLMAIKKTPNDSVGYYYEIYHMLKLDNPILKNKIGVY